MPKRKKNKRATTPKASPQHEVDLGALADELNGALAEIAPQTAFNPPGRTFWPEPHGCVRRPEEDQETFMRRVWANAELVEEAQLRNKHNATTLEARLEAELALRADERPGEIKQRLLMEKRFAEEDRRREEAEGRVQAQARKRRFPKAAILDDIRAAFERVRDTDRQGGNHHAACREAMDLAAANLGLLNDCASKHGATPTMQGFLRGDGQTLNAVPLCTYSALPPAQRGAKYMSGADGPTWAEWCASALEAVPDGEQIMADLERWAGQASTTPNNGKELPWEEDASGFIPLAEAVRYAKTEYGLPWTEKRFGRLLTSNGPIHYMRRLFKGGRGGRCKVNLEEARDFFAYAERASKASGKSKSEFDVLDAPAAIIDEYLKGIGARQADIRQEKQARGERPNSHAIPT